MQEDKPSVKTDYISFPSAAVARLMRGANQSNVDRIKSVFNVQIGISHRRDDPFRHSVRGTEHDVDLVISLLRDIGYDAALMTTKRKLKSKFDIKETHFDEFTKIVRQAISSYASKRGEEKRIDRAVERASTNAAKTAVDQLRKAIGPVSSTPPASSAAAPGAGAPVKALPMPAIPTARLKTLTIAPFNPRNPLSGIFYKSLESPEVEIGAAVGAAGSSKTYTPMNWAFNAIAAGQYARLVIFRNRMTLNKESFGAVGGDADDKMRPYLNALEKNLIGMTGEGISQLKDRRILDVDTGDFMLGDTLDDTIIMIDEAQNYPVDPIMTLTTRIGQNSKLVYTGDIAHQSHLHLEESGLAYLIHHFFNDAAEEPDMAAALSGVLFASEDSIARSPTLPRILRAVGKTPATYKPVLQGTRADEMEKSAIILENRAQAVDLMKKLSAQTEQRFKRQAEQTWPAQAAPNLSNVAFLQTPANTR